MCQPNRWWRGLVPLLAVWVALNWVETGRVEHDLSQRASAAVTSAGALVTGVAAAGRDVAIEGQVFDDDQRAGAVDAANRLDGIRLVSATFAEPAVAKPYVWSANLDDARLTLSGNTPSPAMRAALLAAARQHFPNVQVIDRMSYASGAAAGFSDMAAATLIPLSRLASGTVRLSDSTFNVTGAAKTPAAYQAALQAARSVPAPLKLASAEIAAAQVSPYTWLAAVDGKTVTLAGYVASEKQRAAVVARAKAALPSLTVSDKLEIADGAPASLDATVDFALAQLGRLENGRAAITDAALTITGTGKINVDANAIATAAGLPAGVALDASGIVASAMSPYVFGATKADGLITLTGFYPDPKTHSQIVDDAKARFAPLALADKLVQARGAPAGYTVAVSAGFEQLSRLPAGELELHDTKAVLSGQAYLEKAADQVKTAFAGAMPPGFTAQIDLAVPAATAPVDGSACQQQLSEALGKDQVLFDSGRADLSPRSTGLLDHLASIALQCPGSPIEIAGHTDNVGTPAVNEALAKRRAQAVVDYLTAAGLDPSRLTAIGYGDTRPVAPNDSDEGKAQNRRIDFIVK